VSYFSTKVFDLIDRLVVLIHAKGDESIPPPPHPHPKHQNQLNSSRSLRPHRRSSGGSQSIRFQRCVCQRAQAPPSAMPPQAPPSPADPSAAAPNAAASNAAPVL